SYEGDIFRRHSHYHRFLAAFPVLSSLPCPSSSTDHRAKLAFFGAPDCLERRNFSGIAGSSTIIVRIIACFQPLQDCQAEYFRHLLKPVT
ncbi:hypothetical protein BHE74_00043011, partial [Ensete ventricosum]